MLMAPVALKAPCSCDPMLVECPLLTRGAVRSGLVLTHTQREASLRASLALWAASPSIS
jgi:hypothetical protein